MPSMKHNSIRTTIIWPTFFLLVAGVLLITTPDAEARTPPRKKPLDPILSLTTIDNEGPITFMPIHVARKTRNDRRATPPSEHLVDHAPRAFVGPPPRRFGSTLHTLEMGPAPRR